MEKRWVIKKNADQETIIRLIEQLGISRPLANILGQREIRNFEESRAFFRPTLAELHDPFLMLGMYAAVNRIQAAIAANENVLVYGDYDVDGTTAVALMYQYLTKNYDQVGYYIPDRYTEGYGISHTGVDFAIDNSFSLVIALDCGIKAMDEIAYAKNNGVDFIVCDHHIPGSEIPDAIILNPKQKGCGYPFKELSGCGVGFKLVQALNQHQGDDLEEIMPFLDLVVVSIGADMVSVSGENRVLAYFGLRLLNQEPRIGLKRMLELSNAKGDLSISDVVFSIAPRINAAGRIGSGNKAVELLLAGSNDEVMEAGASIHAHNETRKGLDRQITEEALGAIASDSWLINAKTTVVFNANWHKGVVGIVASRLIEKYYRPTIVLTESNGEIVGSARSIKGFNLYEAIAKCSDLLTRFGGHYYAAGLTLPADNLAAFKLKFDSVAQEMITADMLVPEIEIDDEIDFRDIFGAERGCIPKFYRVLKQLAPFGPDNMAPVFVSRQVKDNGQSRLLKDNHLKLSLFQEDYPDIILDAVAFDFGHLINRILHERFDVVYTIAENFWQGKSTLQLMVKDIRFGN